MLWWFRVPEEQGAEAMPSPVCGQTQYLRYGLSEVSDGFQSLQVLWALPVPFPQTFSTRKALEKG